MIEKVAVTEKRICDKKQKKTTGIHLASQHRTTRTRKLFAFLFACLVTENRFLLYIRKATFCKHVYVLRFVCCFVFLQYFETADKIQRALLPKQNTYNSTKTAFGRIFFSRAKKWASYNCHLFCQDMVAATVVFTLFFVCFYDCVF